MPRALPTTLLLLAYAAPAAAQPGAVEHFEKKVRPLLVEKCVSCHGPEKQKGGLRLDSRAALLTGGERGPALIPGEPGKSLLVRALAHDGDVQMPPKGKLPAADIAAVTAWVKGGAPWPDSAGAAAAPRTTGPRPITAEEKTFWAFQPVLRPPIPEIPNTKQLTRNPIDAFLLAKLADQGLSFAPPADRRLLLRRVTFDLTGLPPTPAEVEAFLRDPAPDAYERVVDRLLASPAYGEKWGRRWLDVARYADSNGMDENLAYVNAWRYRDWVVRSLNADKPYDQFVREQIAGDLMGGTDEERAARLTATGFLVIGPKMLAEDDPMKMRMDIIDEQLDTLGQAVMGLTLGCARCHDHKFDPIRAEDYYGLAGMFYSTRSMKTYSVVATWNERPVGSAESVAAAAEHTKKVAAAKSDLTAFEGKLKAAAATRLSDERKRAAEYAAEAAEVLRRRGPLKLIVADPAKDAPAGTIRVESEAFTRGNVLKLTDGYGAGIGVVINAGQLPNFAEYDVEVATAGTYQLAVRYAAADARPVRVLVGGKLVAGKACDTRTGSWNPDTQQWHPEAVVPLAAGKTTLRFERDGPFPHLDKFALLPMTAEQVAATPVTVEQAAAGRKLLAPLLRQWVDELDRRKGEPPSSAELDALAAKADGPFRLTPDAEAEVGAGQAERTRLKAAVAALEKARPPLDEAMAVEDAKGENLRVHLRGNHLTLGAEVPRRFPRVFGDTSPAVGAGRSGRLELAEWLTRPDHPLTARVMVNRLWAGHFGTGIVRTPDNFGKLGERPSHPELLDWLTAEFVEKGWSLKHMHRLMVTSAAYRMASTADPVVIQRDPENRLLSRFPRRRLDAEEVRDGMLAAAGLLDRTMGGSLLKANPRQYVTSTANRNYDGYSVPRRSLYLPVIRSAVFDVLQTLDFPDPSVPNGQRAATTIPTQALLMLNGPLVDNAAEVLAKGVLATPGDDAAHVREAYRRAFGRAPTTAELDRVTSYLRRSEAGADPMLSATDRRLRAWRGLCRVLLASNEFVFVE